MMKKKVTIPKYQMGNLSAPKRKFGDVPNWYDPLTSKFEEDYYPKSDGVDDLYSEERIKLNRMRDAYKANNDLGMKQLIWDYENDFQEMLEKDHTFADSNTNLVNLNNAQKKLQSPQISSPNFEISNNQIVPPVTSNSLISDGVSVTPSPMWKKDGQLTESVVSNDSPYTVNQKPLVGLKKKNSFDFNAQNFSSLYALNSGLDMISNLRNNNSSVISPFGDIQYTNGRNNQSKYGYSFQKGGTKQNPPKVYTDKKKFEQAQRMYNDSLNLYNINNNYKDKYLDFVSKAGFDKTKVKEWNTDGYVNTEQQQKIGAVSNGVLTNSGGGFERDNKGNLIYYNYFPLNNGKDVKVYDNSFPGTILTKRYSNYKKPVQPVVYQPQQTINTTKGLVKGRVIQNDGKNAAVWNSQLVQTKPTHPVTYMKRLSMSNRDLNNPNIQMQGQTIPLPEMRLPQQGNNPFYGPGNTIVGYTDDNRQFYPAQQYTGSQNNQSNLQDRELLNNPELLRKYVQSKDTYKFQKGGYVWSDENDDFLFGDEEDTQNVTKKKRVNDEEIVNQELQPEVNQEKEDINNALYADLMNPYTRKNYRVRQPYQVEESNSIETTSIPFREPNIVNLKVNSGTVAVRHNNPGNLKYASWMDKYGAVKGSAAVIDNKRFGDKSAWAHFPNPEAGLKARMELLFDRYPKNMNLETALRRYSGSDYGAEIFPEIRGKSLGQLSEQEKLELTKRQIAREDKGMYKILKDKNIFQKGGTKVNFPKFDPTIIQQKPIVDKGNFSNIPFTSAQQKTLQNVRQKEKEIALNQLRQEQSARSAKEKGTAFKLPNNQTKTYNNMSVKEKAYVNGQSLRNKGRWNENSTKQPFLNNFNPVTLLFDLAAGLGEAPLMSDVTNSAMPYVTGIGMPLTVGALAGMGSKTTGQFVNNLVNPLAGTGDLVNNLGNKYLPNAHKYNPFAFKPNSEMGYRMLGQEGFDDAINTGVLRAKPIPGGATKEGISLARNTNRNPNTGKMQPALDRPYFADGFIDERYAADYMAAVNKANNNLIPIPTHKGIAPSQAGSIPLENATLYQKDWLQGYKEIPKPTSSFKSEIDWKNWNKEIPANQGLMNEYNAIDYKKNPLSAKEKEMYQWFDEQMRFDKLPQTTNKQSIEVLDNFKQRIRTPEGQKRLKELGITEEQLLQDLKIVEDTNTYGYYRGLDKNTIAMNPNHPLPKKVVRHEIEHGVQNALRKSKINKAIDGTPAEKLKALESTTTEIDDILSELTLRREGTPNKVWNKINTNETVNINDYKSLISNKQNATDYFLTGSDGAEKSAFLGEVQQYMMDTGVIPKNSYTHISPKMVHDTFVNAMFDEKTGGKYLRLFNIIKADPNNYEIISKGLNKMLSITPLIGAGAYMQNKEYKNGGAIGNNGMFDMTNPNIYKALVPAIGAGVLSQKKLGGKMNDNKGYLINNLHNFTPKKIINSNHITSENLAFPIVANNVPIYPNTGDYIFPTNKVVEKPMYQQGGTYYVSNADLANLKQKNIKFRYV